MKVKVVDYNSKWPIMFNKEAEKIKKILGDELVAIYHIGSTSVENLKAKPIIDIMLVVKSIANVDRYNQEFEALGYEPMGEYGIPSRRYFRKGIKTRAHHVHIFDASNIENIERHLAVRDYLRAHSRAATEYGELKSKLAAKYSSDIDAYCDGKDAFVKELERKALTWYHQVRTLRNQ